MDRTARMCFACHPSLAVRSQPPQAFLLRKSVHLLRYVHSAGFFANETCLRYRSAPTVKMLPPSLYPSSARETLHFHSHQSKAWICCLVPTTQNLVSCVAVNIETPRGVSSDLTPTMSSLASWSPVSVNISSLSRRKTTCSF